MKSPLEQFDVVLEVKSLGLLNYHMVLLWLLVSMVLVCMFYAVKLVPSNYQMVFESIYMFVLEMMVQQNKDKGMEYFPMVFSLFMLILSLNLMSLVPYGIAVTSQLICVLNVSLGLTLGLVVMGLNKKYLQFFLLFIPECPFMLLFLLMPIEMFSYIMSMFSLGMSLVANMMAGHTLVYLLSNFIYKMVKGKWMVSSVLMFSIMMLFVLEFCVAFLQAYVFVILYTLYMADSL